MQLKFSVVNVAEQTWNTFSKQVTNSVQQSFVEITERLFKKAVPIHFVNYFIQIIFSVHKCFCDFIIYLFIYNFNWITQYNSTLTPMPSPGRNCYLLLRLKLISRSPLWLGSNIFNFHSGGPSLIPDIILIYAFFLIVKVI